MRSHSYFTSAMLLCLSLAALSACSSQGHKQIKRELGIPSEKELPVKGERRLPELQPQTNRLSPPPSSQIAVKLITMYEPVAFSSHNVQDLPEKNYALNLPPIPQPGSLTGAAATPMSLPPAEAITQTNLRPPINQQLPLGPAQLIP